MSDVLEPTAPGGAPASEGEAPAAPDPGARIAALEQDLARERGQRQAYEDTLRLLAPSGGGGGGGVPTGPVRLPHDSAQRIAATLGGEWSEQAVQAHAPIFAAFLQELAGPLLVGIEGMADAVDLVSVRQEVPGYESLAQEADRVRGELRQRGQVVSRKQAVALVKARRLEDPRYMDTLVEQRRQQQETDRAARAAAAAAGVTEGGPSAQKAGPEPTKGGRFPLTKEEFARLPLEEKRARLGDLPI